MILILLGTIGFTVNFVELFFLNIDECRDHEYTHHQVIDQVREIILLELIL